MLFIAVLNLTRTTSGVAQPTLKSWISASQTFPKSLLPMKKGTSRLQGFGALSCSSLSVQVSFFGLPFSFADTAVQVQFCAQHAR